MDTTGEKMTVPIMNFILLSLLPLVMVRKSPFKSFAAANGQFMLFRSDIYRLFQPHERLKNSMVEDIRIARYFKEKREKVACLAVDSGVQCRMYQGFKDAVNGFSKNVFEFFGNSAILALLFWIVTSFGFLLIIRELTVIYVVIWLIAYVVTRIIISILSGQNITDNLIYLIPQQLTFGLFIYQAFINKYFKTFRWKGREIYQ
jgi:hypothetical protein